MRDEHNIKTDSTSPPPKKQKKSDSKIVEEPMDTESDTVNDLSGSFEDMDIDSTVSESMGERSKIRNLFSFNKHIY